MTLDGVCRGALVWNAQHGKTMVWAKQTILATGGAGQLYRETTNPEVATGDGMALAYRAGAELRDMEFMQFHPTVLYIAGGSRSLISEAVRGEGAWLVDRHGHRFMTDYDPRGELAPRDVVSLAIVSQMEKTRHPNVYLELNHLDPAKVRARFPGIAAVCAEFDLDITRDRIPVRPGAHYMMGGVTVDLEGRTTLPRPLGGGRSDRQRPARGQPPGLQQPAGGAGVRRACRRRGLAGRRRAARRLHRLGRREPAGRNARRAAEPGRHPQLAAKPDVAQHGRPARRRRARPRPSRASTTGAATCCRGSSPIRRAGNCRTCSARRG